MQTQKKPQRNFTQFEVKFRRERSYSPRRENKEGSLLDRLTSFMTSVIKLFSLFL